MTTPQVTIARMAMRTMIPRIMRMIFRAPPPPLVGVVATGVPMGAAMAGGAPVTAAPHLLQNFVPSGRFAPHELQNAINHLGESFTRRREYNASGGKSPCFSGFLARP